MKTSLGVVLAVLVLLAGVVHAQHGLDGKWEGETSNGAALVLDLAVKGTALTGTLARNERTTDIAEGTVANNRFNFKATVGDQTETFSGELIGDRLRIWLDRQGEERAIVLRRAERR